MTDPLNLAVHFAPLVRAGLPGWLVEPDGAPDLGGAGGVWVHCEPPYAEPLPAQGWKLHVSATVLNAEEVLGRVLPVIARHRVTFKVTAEGVRLARLNAGLDGASQVGKFLTIYPVDDERAVELAVELDGATDDLVAPRVPSDRPLREGSLVHYRFGGFSQQRMQTFIGQPVLSLTRPDGTQVPDRRTTRFSSPEWVTDPFEAAGLVAAPKARERVAGGRFLKLLQLTDAARGAVWSVVDLHEGQRAILKLAWPGSAAGPDGLDSVGRLEVESHLLGTLPPETGAPRLLATGEHDGGRFVAMEEVPGDTADAVVNRMRARGATIPPLRIARWAHDLAVAMSAVHKAGYVYRDFKAANVIVTAEDGSTSAAAFDGTGGDPAPGVDRARLIDFELAKPIGTPAVYSDGGTRSHRAPERDHAAAVPSDDVFGFGAVLWGWVCATDPAFNPHDTDLDRLDPHLLNPDLDEGLLALARACLRPDPTRRPTVEQVLQQLELVIAKETGNVPRVRPDGEAPNVRQGRTAHHTPDWLGLAEQAGADLLAMGVRDDAGLSFPSRSREVTGVPSRTVYEGNAGAVLALAALVAAGMDRFTESLKQAADWLVHETTDLPRLPGLFAGEAGVAVALAQAGQTLDRDELAKAALATAMQVAEMPGHGPDIISGDAGLVRAHVHLAAVLDDHRPLVWARAAGRRLLEAAVTEAVGVAWPLPEGVFRLGGRACYGYAHGAAGVVDALLDLHAVTGEDALLEPVDRAVEWILAGAQARGEAMCDWPEFAGAEPFGAYWCHGAGGVAPVLARVGEVDAARRGARLLARTRHCGTTRCHGLAGNAEQLLDLADRLDDRGLHEAALEMAALLAAWRQDHRGWPGDHPDHHSGDYMAGVAGLVPLFLRLADHHAGDPLMLSR